MTVITSFVASLAAIVTLHQYYTIFGQNRRLKYNNLQAWPEDKSRDMKVYVHPNQVTTIHEPRNICSKTETGQLFLLIIIYSASGNFEVRKNIRKQWALTRAHILGLILQNERKREKRKDLNKIKINLEQTDLKITSAVSKDLKDFRVVFMLGLSPSDALNKNNATQQKIDQEAAKYGDIIQERFMDTMYNSSIKSVMFLKWLTRNCKEKVRYILKTDDDISVNILPLLISLAERSVGFDKRNLNNLTPEPEYVLMGDRKCDHFPKRKLNNRWYVPEYLYENEVYPCFVYGRGYVYTIPTAIALYNASLQTYVFPFEDVYITGIVREEATPEIPLDHDDVISRSIDVNPALENRI